MALVGPTGSGKSTFVKLIQRLYDLKAGRILIDGQDIADGDARPPCAGHRRGAPGSGPVPPPDRARTSPMPGPAPRPKRSPLAARRARAHDFIARLPKGYDTLVGERGVKLSGGERQRVAIARAFLADAPILVLDEATSSLDVETELQVQAATEELMAGRTTIVIAHRLSTIRSGRPHPGVRQGPHRRGRPHADLVAAGGAYARLHAVSEG